jgi:hypothetical protein
MAIRYIASESYPDNIIRYGVQPLGFRNHDGRTFLKRLAMAAGQIRYVVTLIFAARLQQWRTLSASRLRRRRGLTLDNKIPGASTDNRTLSHAINDVLIGTPSIFDGNLVDHCPNINGMRCIKNFGISATCKSSTFRWQLSARPLAAGACFANENGEA